MKIIASYGLTNTASINIYDIDYTEDKVLAGLNDQEPKWCPIDYSNNTFKWCGWDLSLDKCIRI